MLTSEERRNLDTAHFGQNRPSMKSSIVSRNEDKTEAQLLQSLEKVVEETARDDNTVSDAVLDD